MQQGPEKRTELNFNEIVKTVTFFMEMAKSQGFGLVLLCGFAYYMYLEKVQMQSQLDKCNTEILQIYQQQNEAFRDVVKENTEAVKTFSVFIQNTNK